MGGNETRDPPCRRTFRGPVQKPQNMGILHRMIEKFLFEASVHAHHRECAERPEPHGAVLALSTAAAISVSTSNP